MNTTFVKHDDPSHGWLQVGLVDLKNVGTSIDDYSGYSYRKGNILFLEEDCDASKFVEAWKAKFGSYPNITYKHHKGYFPEDNNLIGLHSGI